MATSRGFSASLASAAVCVVLAGCASTTVMLAPSPQAPVCDGAASALVLWAPQWRADQKDVAAREAAAAQGIEAFFTGSRCFARAQVRRVADLEPATVAAQVAASAASAGPVDWVVTLGVRELGPVVRLLSSAALVEGGTEVVLQVTAQPVQGAAPPRAFGIHWRHGGPGVVKGVAGLPVDLQAALSAGLQPAAAAR